MDREAATEQFGISFDVGMIEIRSPDGIEPIKEL